jgi:hypothetical protein
VPHHRETVQLHPPRGKLDRFWRLSGGEVAIYQKTPGFSPRSCMMQRFQPHDADDDQRDAR